MSGDECIILNNDYHPVGDLPVASVLVQIEDGAWLASRVIILRGITIGEESAIGAGAVVTRSVPPRYSAVGNPERVVRQP